METRKKSFDCLEFKALAQQSILERLQGLSMEDQRQYLRKAAEEGPFGDWWRRVKARAADREDLGRTSGPDRAADAE